MTRNEGETSFRKLSASILAVTMVSFGSPFRAWGEVVAPVEPDPVAASQPGMDLGPAQEAERIAAAHVGQLAAVQSAMDQNIQVIQTPQAALVSTVVEPVAPSILPPAPDARIVPEDSVGSPQESPVSLEKSEAEETEQEAYNRRVLSTYDSQLRDARQMDERREYSPAIVQLASTLWDMAAMIAAGGSNPPMSNYDLERQVRERYNSAFPDLLRIATTPGGFPRTLFIGTGNAGLALSWYIGSGAVPDAEIARVRGFYEGLRGNQDALLASLSQTAETSQLIAWLVPSFSVAARQFFLQAYTDAFAAFRGANRGISQVVRRLTEVEEAMLRQWGSARLTEAQRIEILRLAASRFSNLAALYENMTELGVQIAGFNGPDDSPMETAYGTLTAVIAAARATIQPD